MEYIKRMDLKIYKVSKFMDPDEFQEIPWIEQELSVTVLLRLLCNI